MKRDVVPYPKAPQAAPKERKRIPPRSKRVIDRQPDREACREIVLERAGHECQYAAIWPGLPCAWVGDRRQLEVDEVRGGSYRSVDQYDPEWCRATCPYHHDVKTHAKTRMLVERIMEAT